MLDKECFVMFDMISKMPACCEPIGKTTVPHSVEFMFQNSSVLLAICYLGEFYFHRTE